MQIYELLLCTENFRWYACPVFVFSVTVNVKVSSSINISNAFPCNDWNNRSALNKIKQRGGREGGYSIRQFNECFVLCFAVCRLIVICLHTHRFDVVTKEDVSHVARALEAPHVQLSLWTHRLVSCGLCWRWKFRRMRSVIALRI